VEPIAVLVKAVEQTGRIVGGVRPDQLSAPTPCTEWDVRELLNHTISVIEMFDDAAQTKPFDPSIFGRDNVGADPGLAYQARAAVLCQTLARPGAAEAAWTLPFGEIPAETAIGFATVEVFQHAWDVAKATGQEVDFDPEVTEVATAQARIVPGDQTRIPVAFADPSPHPERASAEDQLAAYLGRTV
jgi:uncharacterized protein (TIGR03086 family)